jgi:hypothetical protein
MKLQQRSGTRCPTFGAEGGVKIERRVRRRKIEMNSEKQRAAIRKKYRERIDSGLIAYDRVVDAYYFTATGEWVEPKCGDDKCDFCALRPDKHVVPNDKLKR